MVKTVGIPLALLIIGKTHVLVKYVCFQVKIRIFLNMLSLVNPAGQLQINQSFFQFNTTVIICINNKT